jgi:hypothetical protein
LAFADILVCVDLGLKDGLQGWLLNFSNAPLIFNNFFYVSCAEFRTSLAYSKTVDNVSAYFEELHWPPELVSHWLDKGPIQRQLLFERQQQYQLFGAQLTRKVG